MIQSKLRVWHIPQVPGPAFYVHVNTPEQAMVIINALQNYDLFQFHNRIKPDYCNTSGLEVWDENEQDWLEWSCEDMDSEYYGVSINEMMDELP